MKRLLPAAMSAVARNGGLPSPDRILSEGHRPEVHDEIRGRAGSHAKALEALYALLDGSEP